MKILLGNNHLCHYGGSETFTYTMAKELQRLGHEVHVLTNKCFFGAMTDQLVYIGIRCIDKPEEDYDLIIVSHNAILQMILDSGIKGFKILTCHGIYSDLEQPIKGADAYVSISDEVWFHLDNLGYKSEIIHNGIDCERFKQVNTINSTLKSIGSLCKDPKANELIKSVCDSLNLKFTSIHDIWNVQDSINESDLIIGLGRSVYEGLACGRNVIAMDNRVYFESTLLYCGDGLLTDENIGDSLKCNCSGRFFRKGFTQEMLIEEFKKYNPSLGEWGRQYALENFNIEKQIQKYLKLYEDFSSKQRS